MPALVQQCVEVLVTQYSDTILNECSSMIKNNESERKRFVLLFPNFYKLLFYSFVQTLLQYVLSFSVFAVPQFPVLLNLIVITRLKH